MTSRITEQKGCTVKYSFVQIFLWMGYVPVLGFASVYLLQKGFSNTQIGLLCAAAALLSALIQPPLAAHADRRNSPKLTVYLLIMGALLVLMGGLLLIPGKPAALEGLFLGIALVILPALTPFVNSLGTESLNQGKKLNYGVARGIGSAAYALISSVLGVLASRFGVFMIPFSIMLVFLCFLAATALFPFQKTERAEAEEKPGQRKGQERFFQRYGNFAWILVGCTLLYVCHALMNNFLFQIVESKGGGSAEMGTCMAICACAELPVMFLFGSMVKRVRCDIWFRLTGVFYTLKILGTLLVPGIAGLYAIQILQMFGWALICVASVYYVNELMEPQDAIKGQAWMTATFSIGAVIASCAGGWLIDQFGVRTMLLFATAASALGMVILLRFCKRIG